MATSALQERFPPPDEGEQAWIVDALGLPGTDEGLRALREADLPEDVLDLVRLASVGLALLAHHGVASFAELTDDDLSDVVLTAEQGRAWSAAPGLLTLLRSTVRGRAKGLKFVVCTGCGRWMLAGTVPKAKSCPLTPDCTGPQVGVPAGVVTRVPPPTVAA